MEYNPSFIGEKYSIISAKCFMILVGSRGKQQPVKIRLKIDLLGTSLVVQWIGLRTLNAGGPGSIPGQGTRSHMHAAAESLHVKTKKPMCRN